MPIFYSKNSDIISFINTSIHSFLSPTPQVSRSPTLSSQHPESSIEYPASTHSSLPLPRSPALPLYLPSIQNPVSSIQYPVSSIQHPVSSIHPFLSPAHQVSRSPNSIFPKSAIQSAKETADKNPKSRYPVFLDKVPAMIKFFDH